MHAYDEGIVGEGNIGSVCRPQRLVENSEPFTKVVADREGRTALLVGARYSKFGVVEWLLESGWSSLDEVDSLCKSAWDYLERYFCPLRDVRNVESEKVLNLLRAMLLRGDPPPSFHKLTTPMVQEDVAGGGTVAGSRLTSFNGGHPWTSTAR
jgi:hypothetical protein